MNHIQNKLDVQKAHVVTRKQANVSQNNIDYILLENILLVYMTNSSNIGTNSILAFVFVGIFMTGTIGGLVWFNSEFRQTRNKAEYDKLNNEINDLISKKIDIQSKLGKETTQEENNKLLQEYNNLNDEIIQKKKKKMLIDESPFRGSTGYDGGSTKRRKNKQKLSKRNKGHKKH